MLAHFSGNVRHYHVTVFKLHPEHGIREGLGNRPFHFDMFFLCHKPAVPCEVKRGIIPEIVQGERLS